MSLVSMEIEKIQEPEESRASTMIVQIITDEFGFKLECPTCNKSSISLNGFMKHMKKHEPPGGFHCNFCEDRFCHQDLLEMHKNEKHTNLACKICFALFDDAQGYTTHIHDIHNGNDRPTNACDKCTMKFKSKKALKRHQDSQCNQIKSFSCDDCEMKFHRKYNLAEHTKVHLGKKTFCSFCGKRFLNNQKLAIHEKSHTEKLYKCQVCDKYFPDRNTLSTHLSTHSDAKTNTSFTNGKAKHEDDPLHSDDNLHYGEEESSHSNLSYSPLMIEGIDIQQLFDELIATKDELLAETEDELSENKKNDLPSCKRCRMVLDQFSKQVMERIKLRPEHERSAFVKRHRLIKKGRTYNCKYCVKMYHIRKPYEKHLREQHHKTEDELRAIFKEEDHAIPDDFVHRCPICLKIYLRAKPLQTHLLLHGPDGSLTHRCPCRCKLYFTNEKNAMEHAKKEHKASLYCDICKKYSQTPEALTIHKKAHVHKTKTKDRNYICDKCAKSFAGRTALNDHTRSNCGRDPLYTCDVCGKKLTSASILKTHSLLHTTETPYACDKCDKAFKMEIQLKLHVQRIHSNDKPFKCEYCPKQYPYRQSLLAHLAIHTGIKRYVCDGCSKRFPSISGLQTHRKSHASTCGLLPLNSKPSQYVGVKKGSVVIGTKSSF